MAKVTLSIRLEPQLKRDFELQLEQEELTSGEKIMDWINRYLQGLDPSGQKPGQEALGSIGQFLKDNDVDWTDIHLGERPLEFYRDDMDFSWMFSGEDLKHYYREEAGGAVNKTGWFLTHWLWTFLWSWLATFKMEKRTPTEELFDRWWNGEDPVDTVVALGSGDKKFSAPLRDLIKAYTTDKDRIKNW